MAGAVTEIVEVSGDADSDAQALAVDAVKSSAPFGAWTEEVKRLLPFAKVRIEFRCSR